jgi:hypothetical protein
MVSNVRAVGKYVNGKDLERIGHGIISADILTCAEGLRTIKEFMFQDS